MLNIVPAATRTAAASSFMLQMDLASMIEFHSLSDTFTKFISSGVAASSTVLPMHEVGVQLRKSEMPGRLSRVVSISGQTASKVNTEPIAL